MVRHAFHAWDGRVLVWNTGTFGALRTHLISYNATTFVSEPEGALVVVHRCRVVTLGEVMKTRMEDPEVVDSLH